MLKRWQTIGAVVALLLTLRVPAAAAPPAAPALTFGLKPAITDSPIRAGRSIQLGAWRSAAEARAAWLGISGRAGNLLVGLAPDIVLVDLAGKGRFYRLRVAQPDPGSAANLCDALKARRLACVMVAD